MDGVVLVLNQNYEPLNVCNLPRAFRLVFGAKAEVIEYDHQTIRTPRAAFRAPSVIRLQHHIRRPRPRVKPDPPRGLRPRRATPASTAGAQGHDLTLDHVVPRHRGGEPHVGQPGHRVQGLQPPQGRPDARRRRASASCARRSSRGATSTRSSRRTSRTSATRHGGATSSWARTDGRRAAPGRPAGGRAGAPATRSRTASARSRACSGAPATRRTWSAAACATCCAASRRSTGTSPPTPGRIACSRSSRARGYENRFGTVAVPLPTGRTRSRRSATTGRTPTIAGPTTSRSATPWTRTSRGATSRSTPSPSRSMPTGSRAPSSTRFGGRADLAARRAARGRRPGDALRGGRPADAPGGPLRRDARGSTMEPGDARRDRGRGGARRPRLGGAHRRRAGAAARAPSGRRSACGWRRRPACSRSSRPSWPPGGDPAGQGPRRGPLGAHLPDRRRGLPRARRRPARRDSRPCSTTSASRPPSPTATSGPRRGRGAARDGLAGGAPRASRRRRRAWPPGPPPHVPVLGRVDATPRSGASSGGSASPTSTRSSTCGRPTTSGAASPATSTASRSSGPAATRRSRRTPRSTGPTLRSTATTSCAGSGWRPGRPWGGCSTSCSSGSSSTRCSTSATRLLALAREIAAGGADAGVPDDEMPSADDRP